MLSQKYPSILKSIHPSSVRTSKEKKNLAVQHNINKQTNKPDGGKKLQPIQPSFQKDTTTLIVHIYLYLLWHREN